MLAVRFRRTSRRPLYRMGSSIPYRVWAWACATQGKNDQCTNKAGQLFIVLSVHRFNGSGSAARCCKVVVAAGHFAGGRCAGLAGMLLGIGVQKTPDPVGVRRWMFVQRKDYSSSVSV